MNGDGASTPLRAEWRMLTPEAKPAWGTPYHVSVRYSHVAVPHAGSLVVSHGYFYNHDKRSPAWLSDTWRFEPSTLAWARVHGPWAAGDTDVPSPRYSMSVVVAGDSMLMFGGDDGGHLKSPDNYVFGAYSDELWEYHLANNTWARARPAPGAAWPPKRALHGAALVNGRMHVYGGIDLADHWALDLRTRRWLRVHASSADSANQGLAAEFVDRAKSGPGSRHALALAAGGDGRGLYLFGGTRHATKGFKPLVLDDLWYFREAAVAEGALRGVWRRLGSAREAAPRPWPPPRAYHSLLALGEGSGVDVGVLLFGGARCEPGCACYNDTWAYLPETRRFEQFLVASPPIWRYRQTLVPRTDSAGPAGPAPAEPGRPGGSEQGRHFLLYGGESYKPYMYHNAVEQLSLPIGWLQRRVQAARAAEARRSPDPMPAWLAPLPSARPAAVMPSPLTRLRASTAAAVAVASSATAGAVSEGQVGLLAGLALVLLALGLALLCRCCARRVRRGRQRAGYQAQLHAAHEDGQASEGSDW